MYSIICDIIFLWKINRKSLTTKYDTTYFHTIIRRTLCIYTKNHNISDGDPADGTIVLNFENVCEIGYWKSTTFYQS